MAELSLCLQATSGCGRASARAVHPPARAGLRNRGSGGSAKGCLDVPGHVPQVRWAVCYQYAGRIAAELLCGEVSPLDRTSMRSR